MLAEDTRRERLPTGLDAAWHSMVGRAGRLAPRRAMYLRRAGRITALESVYENMSEAVLRSAADDLRARFRLARDSAEDLDRGFALVREIAWRELGLKPFLVQVAGALALDAGCVAEMATGEGKTLTATLPAVIAGWRGRGCHIITVNDYLAKRDAEWMAPVFRMCGLTVGHVGNETPPQQRRAAYRADVTYTTNKEVAADFLRDQLLLARFGATAMGPSAVIASGAGTGLSDQLMQRGLAHAIVDEADSVLIDEAVTPLIISGGGDDAEQVDVYRQAAEFARELTPIQDYRVDHRHREVRLTSAGRERAGELSAPLGGVWRGARRREELIVQALSARELYERDRQYVIHEGKVVIIDESTGRLMPDRTWRNGFHQAVEAKEAIKVNPVKDTLARISFQRFFRLYRRLAGMTGTAREQSGEFWRTYRLPVVVIPTNQPVRRRVLPDRVFADGEAKWAAVVDEIERRHANGQPILVGTRSVHASEHLSELLSQRGLAHEVLNAVRHEQEAAVIAGAGKAGRITVATNMAGRGTDISLDTGVVELGGLHVIATERHESARVDRQLFGRSARQGDPGSAQAFVALDDELPRRFARRLAAVAREVGTPTRLGGLLFSRAQRRAGALAARQRASVLRADDWLDDALGFTGRRH